MASRIKALRIETCPPLARHLFGGFVWRSGHSYKACERLSFAAFLIVGGLFYFAFATNTSGAATYYVDDANGLDTNAGTEVAPWKTITRAEPNYSGSPKVIGGDTVYIKNGTYSSFYQKSPFTEQTSWIKYWAATGHTPVIQRLYYRNTVGLKNMYHDFNDITFQEADPGLDPNDPPSWPATASLPFYITGVNYVHLHNCKLYGWNKYRTGTACEISASANIIIENCDVKTAQNGIYISTQGTDPNVKILYNNIHGLCGGTMLEIFGGVRNVDGLQIEGNHMHDMHKNQYDPYFPSEAVWCDPAVFPQGSPPALIEGEEVWITGLAQGDPCYTAKSIVQCVAWDTSDNPDCYNIYIYKISGYFAYLPKGSICTGQTSQVQFAKFGGDEGIHTGSAVAVRAPYWVFRNNIVHDIEGTGMFFKSGYAAGYFHDIVVENNLFYDVRSGNIGLQNLSAPIVFRNNTNIGYQWNNELHVNYIADRYSNSGGLSTNWTPGFDGTGIYFYNNVFVGGYPLPSPTDPNKNGYSEDYNIYFYASYDANAAKGDNSLVAYWVEPEEGPDHPRGYPNYFEFIGYGSEDSYGGKTGTNVTGAGQSPPYDYDYETNGVTPFFAEKSFLFNPTVGGQFGGDRGKTFSFKLISGSPGINFGAPTVKTYQEVLAGYTGPSQPPDSLGTLGDDGFIIADGPARDAGHHSVGCNEYASADVNNQPPVLDEIGNKSVNENSLLSFSVNATDGNGDTITYTAQNLPSGATFSNKTFSWTPSYQQANTYQVTFIASDGGEQDSETITITVNNVNRAPVLGAIGNKSVNENFLLTIGVAASDPDGGTITYSVNGLPSGAAFAGQTFNWTPTYSQAGNHTVTFVVSDGQAQDSETITINVNNVNRAPVLNAVGNKSAFVNEVLTFATSASDPDGDTLTYSVNGLPTGATFASQSFSWSPASNQVGNHQVSFSASDGSLGDSETITITVLSADTSPPVVANCSPAADSIQVPLNSLVILHITDAGKGVDASSVAIKVNDNVIYSGDTAVDSSAYGNCRRSGTKADYTYMYQPNAMFDFDQSVTVTVNAADLAGNVMSQRSYSFTTEMRSFGQNKKVNSGSDNLIKAAPATVRDNSDNIWAVWQAGSIGSRDIYFGNLTAGADNFGSSIRLIQNTADQCNPAIAIGSDGKLYVVWQDNRNGTWDIYVSTSTGGTSWSAEQRVTDTNDNQINPAIVVDNLNRVYVVWQDDRNGNQDIYAANSSNGFLTATVSQITSNSSDQIEPAIAVGPSNTVYVIWTDIRSGSSDIYGTASNYGPWTNVPIVNSANNQSSPAIAVESLGSTLHIVWVDDRSGNQDIYYATSAGLPGSPLSGSSIIDNTSTAKQSEPVIITNGNSKVFACWQDERNVAADGGDTDLYMTELTSDSRTNILVGDDGTNADQSEPAIGIDEYGHPYLVWTDGRSANTEIYYAASTFVEPVALKAKDVSASAGATVGTEPANISSVDDVSIIVPAGACSCDVKITISKIKNTQAFATPCLGSYDFGPSGMQFSQPVTVTIPYTPSGSGNPTSAYWYNSLTGALSQQGLSNVQNIVISPTLHAFQFKTTHFTAFYLLGGSSEGDDGDSGESSGGGGGGGGGGGCSMSVGGEGDIVEFLLPYVGLAVVMLVLKLRDRRNRKVHGIT